MDLNNMAPAMDNLLAAVQRNADGTITLRFLESNGGAGLFTSVGGLIDGYEIAEVTNITNVRGTLVFSGLKSARMWLRDEGSSAIAKMYYCINAQDTDEADQRLAAAGARMILRMGETIDIPFDADDGVIRIDYVANVAETGANLLYIEGRK